MHVVSRRVSDGDGGEAHLEASKARGSRRPGGEAICVFQSFQPFTAPAPAPTPGTPPPLGICRLIAARFAAARTPARRAKRELTYVVHITMPVYSTDYRLQSTILKQY